MDWPSQPSYKWGTGFVLYPTPLSICCLKYTVFHDIHFQLVTRVPKATQDEMEAATDAAKAAFKTWSKTSILTRQQVMLRYQHIIRNNMVYYYYNFYQSVMHVQISNGIRFPCRKNWQKASQQSKERPQLMLKEMFWEVSVSIHNFFIVYIVSLL